MESIETVMVIFTVGLAILLFGYLKVSASRKLLRAGIPVEGTVFQVIHTGYGNNATYYPVVRFTTADDDEVTEKSETGGNRWSYKEGENVKVIYDPVNPGHFMLDDVRSKPKSLALVYSGIVLMLISVGLLLLGLRN